MNNNKNNQDQQQENSAPSISSSNEKNIMPSSTETLPEKIKSSPAIRTKSNSNNISSRYSPYKLKDWSTKSSSIRSDREQSGPPQFSRRNEFPPIINDTSKRISRSVSPVFTTSEFIDDLNVKSTDSNSLLANNGKLDSIRELKNNSKSSTKHSYLSRKIRKSSRSKSPDPDSITSLESPKIDQSNSPRIQRKLNEPAENVGGMSLTTTSSSFSRLRTSRSVSPSHLPISASFSHSYSQEQVAGANTFTKKREKESKQLSPQNAADELFEGSDVSDLPDHQFPPSSDEITPEDDQLKELDDNIIRQKLDKTISIDEKSDGSFSGSEEENGHENKTANSSTKLVKRNGKKRLESTQKDSVEPEDSNSEHTSLKRPKKRGRPPGSINRKSLSSWEKAQIVALERYANKDRSASTDDPSARQENHDDDDEEQEEENEDKSNSKPSSKQQDRRKEDGIVLSGRKRPLPYSAINTPDRSGRTPIFKYARQGDLESCKILIENGADLNIRDYAGWTALHEACNIGHTDVIQLLLEFGADVNATGDHGDTPLHDAVSGKLEDIIHLLLLYGANMDAQNENEETPLDIASEDYKTLTLLNDWKEMSSMVHSRDELGRTKLHLAASEGSVSQVSKLLHFGADIQAVDNAGWAPIHEAAAHGHHKVLKRLLEYEAQVNELGDLKQTALHVACKNGHRDCTRVLLEFGATINKKDVNGKKPTDLTLKQDILDLFQKEYKPVKTAKFKCKAVNHQQHTMPTIPKRSATEERRRRMSVETQSTTSTNNNQAPISTASLNAKPAGSISREERKFLALLRTIESLESNEQGQSANSSYGSYYVGYPGYEEYEAARMRRKSSVGSAKANKVGQSQPEPTPSSKKRGRPKKPASLESNQSELSSQMDPQEVENDDDNDVKMKDVFQADYDNQSEKSPKYSKKDSKATTGTSTPNLKAASKSIRKDQTPPKQSDGEESLAVCSTKQITPSYKRQESIAEVSKKGDEVSKSSTTKKSSKILESKAEFITTQKRKVSEPIAKEVSSPVLKKKKKLSLLGTGGYMDMSSKDPAGESIAQPMYIKVKSEEEEVYVKKKDDPKKMEVDAKDGSESKSKKLTTKAGMEAPSSPSLKSSNPEKMVSQSSEKLDSSETKKSSSTISTSLQPSSTNKAQSKQKIDQETNNEYKSSSKSSNGKGLQNREISKETSLNVMSSKGQRKSSSGLPIAGGSLSVESTNDAKKPHIVPHKVTVTSPSHTPSTSSRNSTEKDSTIKIPVTPLSSSQSQPAKLRKTSSVASSTESVLEKQENKAKFVIKKKSKKSLLGISGYQDLELNPPRKASTESDVSSSAVDSSAIPAQPASKVSTTPAASVSSDVSTSKEITSGDKEEDKRKKCLPLYTFSLPRALDSSEHCKFILDLQLGMILGHPSGRPVLDSHPKMAKRRATDDEKRRIEKTMMSFTLLECMKVVLGEDATRWTKKVQFKSDGKDYTGMKLSNVDLYVVEYDSALGLLDTLKIIPSKALHL